MSKKAKPIRWTEKEKDILLYYPREGVISQIVIENEVLLLLRGRNYKQVRDKYNNMGINVTSKKIVTSTQSGSNKGTNTGDEEDGNIYYKAATLIGGDYKGGYLYDKAGKQLTAAQTKDALAKAREGL